MEVNKKNIPQEYILTNDRLKELKITYNAGVSNCFLCNYEPKHRKYDFAVIEDIIGFAKNSSNEIFVIWKCKGCGKVYCFHLRGNEDIRIFDYVKFYHDFYTTGTYKI